MAGRGGGYALMPTKTSSDAECHDPSAPWRRHEDQLPCAGGARTCGPRAECDQLGCTESQATEPQASARGRNEDRTARSRSSRLRRTDVRAAARPPRKEQPDVAAVLPGRHKTL
jgi:hypothetical protein